MNVPIIPLAAMDAFRGSNSNHSSRKSAELMVMSLVKYSNCSDDSVLKWSNNFFVLDKSDKDGRMAFGAIVSRIGRTAIPI